MPESLSLRAHVTSCTVGGIYPNVIGPTHIWEGVGIFGGGTIPSRHSQHPRCQRGKRELDWRWILADPEGNGRCELLELSSLAGDLSCSDSLSSSHRSNLVSCHTFSHLEERANKARADLS